MESNSPTLSPALDFIPQRVVSLVPSLTESLFDLGLNKSLVGVTDYCIYPAKALENIPRLGGTKNPRIEDIIALHPDLILANQEENPPEILTVLQDAGLTLWVTFPTTVAQAVDVLFGLVNIFQSDEAGKRVRMLQMSLDWVKLSTVDNTPIHTFCPIWQGKSQIGQRWWMTFNRYTYAHDLLTIVGGSNVFSECWQHTVPMDLVPDTVHPIRYPRVTLDDIRNSQPDLVLLPSEPYAFGADHCQEMRELLADTPAGRSGRFQLVDGSLITWHGTRLGLAIKELPALINMDQADRDVSVIAQ